MATNVTQIPGADEVDIALRNYSYPDSLSGLAILRICLFTDLDKIGYKNASGDLRKLLEDASGSSNTPLNSVFISDEKGRATSNSGLTFENGMIKSSGGIDLGNGFSIKSDAVSCQFYYNDIPCGAGIAL